MTDKEQIIVDGVDVSGCSVYKDGICILARTKCNAVCDYASYYLREQLARKMQECEQKEKELLSNEKIINKLMKEVDELKQECDTLKSQLDFEVQQKECIEQECEELKAQLNDMACMDDDNVLCYPRQELKKECDRYRKALEKIEGLVKNFCKDCDDYENCNWDKEGCYYSLIPNLKDIINKAKGEE